MIITEPMKHSAWSLTDEARQYLADGVSPEIQLLRAIPEDGIDMDELKKQLGPNGETGFRQAMQRRLVAIDKSGGAPKVTRKVPDAEDTCLILLQRVESNSPVDPKEADAGELAPLATAPQHPSSASSRRRSTDACLKGVYLTPVLKGADPMPALERLLLGGRVSKGAPTPVRWAPTSCGANISLQSRRGS